MKKYITKSGDAWDWIAYSQLGDCKYTADLMRANVEHLDRYIFPAGIELTVPEVETQKSYRTPPWK